MTYKGSYPLPPAPLVKLLRHLTHMVKGWEKLNKVPSFCSNSASDQMIVDYLKGRGYTVTKQINPEMDSISTTSKES